MHRQGRGQIRVNWFNPGDTAKLAPFRFIKLAYMSQIDIGAHHEMDHAHAQDAADKLAADLAEKFSIDYGWDEDTIHFERPGVHGMITVSENEIRIQAELDFFLTLLKTRIEKEIVSYLQEHFNCTFNA